MAYQENVLQVIPPILRKNILLLFQFIFGNLYPLQWSNQLLSLIEKKGHRSSDPKLRGIAVGSLLSRLYDIILNNRFCSWYVPNPQQAGFRENQGCRIIVIH